LYRGPPAKRCTWIGPGTTTARVCMAPPSSSRHQGTTTSPPAHRPHRPHLPRTCPSHAPPTIHHRHHCREKTAEDVANPSSSSEAFTTLTEGRATILTQGNNEAFYNPAQVVNRDLSIAVINHFQKVRATETMVLSHKQRRWVYCGGYPIRRRRTPTHARH